MTDNYFKRFIFDLDDTISFTVNRDFRNALPNRDIIDKINALYNSGWEIWIVTARGMLSCNGDLAVREQTYRQDIIDWLKDHGVRYHNLSFNKVLGAYYVDDKAINVEQFREMQFDIVRGFSGNEVFVKDKAIVSKISENSIYVASWYERARELLYNVPEVHSLVGNALNISYIDGHKYQKNTVKNLLCDLIDSFSHHNPYNAPSDFSFYIDRVTTHLSISELRSDLSDSIIRSLTNISDLMNKNRSFMHGDFTIDNVLLCGREIYMIDPNPIAYSSYLLDISKLAMSFRLNDMSEDLSYLYRRYSDKSDAIKILEISHWIRMLKYVRVIDDIVYNRSIDHINKLILEIK